MMRELYKTLEYLYYNKIIETGQKKRRHKAKGGRANCTHLQEAGFRTDSDTEASVLFSQFLITTSVNCPIKESALALPIHYCKH